MLFGNTEWKSPAKSGDFAFIDDLVLKSGPGYLFCPHAFLVDIVRWRMII